jgi:hypothetical protein
VSHPPAPSFPVAQLPPGPLDIVGDIHGELEALETLLERLGYRDGEHPDGRRLVFVGDLVDRGPDSVGVLERVIPWVEAGLASCILGNHELNLLLGERKAGNGWWFGEEERWTSHGRSGSYDSRLATEAVRERALAFFGSLPLVLEREDLRVVHAAWSPAAAEALSALDSAAELKTFHDTCGARLTIEAAGDDTYQQERAAFPSLLTTDLTARPPRLPRHGYWTQTRQERLAHKLLTSGSERALRDDEEPFEAGGKWRMATRHRWWDSYEGSKPVVVGHYWRTWDHNNPPAGRQNRADFGRSDHRKKWMGSRENVYCVDFSAGIRFEARAGFGSIEQSRLAALRWDDEPPRLMTDLDNEVEFIHPRSTTR